jgi:hypothetical protein
MKSADRWGWQLQTWPGVPGEKVTESMWDNNDLQLLPQGAIQYRPGAQGCWFSHWGLWKLCVARRQPIVVMEHDAEIRGPWPTDINLDQCVWKLHLPDGRGERVNEITGEWSCGAWAYTLTPRWAQQLITFSIQHGAQAVDKQLGRKAVQWQYWREDLCVHNPEIRMSTTSPKIAEKFNIKD